MKLNRGPIPLKFDLGPENVQLVDPKNICEASRIVIKLQGAILATAPKMLSFICLSSFKTTLTVTSLNSKNSTRPT
jgi:ABC-type uncharacterized transport system permease subunit